jgi:GNAT superfamily N-acetyltransferase
MNTVGNGELDLRRLEEVGLNALQTQRQLFYDGWLLRVSPGKAKRARSVNAHFTSSLPLARKIAHCEKIYAARGFPVLFRITPFVQPPDLDAVLAARGYEAHETTLVQVLRLAQAPEVVPLPDVDVMSPSADVFADAVATLQHATPAQRDAYYERLVDSPLATRALIAQGAGGTLGVGTVMLDDGLAGIFSMATAPAMRGRGVATALLGRLLAWAWDHGATHAYLQVDGDNHRALAVYRRFGFATAYTYHYRARPGEFA